MSHPERVLVLGAQGLIGSAISRRLSASGMDVSGLKRSSRQGDIPGVTWVSADLRNLSKPDDWADLLDGVTHVVNAAGVLQDGGADDLRAVHVTAPRALAECAAERAVQIIQISAAGVSPEASTAFFRTKAEGDAAVLAAAPNAVILRPSLVIAPDCYGGTALIRAIASFPYVQPIALAASTVQTVDVADVAEAVHEAVTGTLPPGTYDLTSDERHTLEDVVLATRRWLGLPKPKRVLRLPAQFLAPATWVADRLRALGWRSPLRSTAVQVLRDGVTANGATYTSATNRTPHSLEATLANYPATNADLIAARGALILPVMIAALSVFWVASGVIGLVRLGAAASILVDQNWAPFAASASVIAFSFLDILLGAAILVRKFARPACLGMIGLALLYLVSATVFTPQLWLDPLGPLVKIIPSTAAALACLALLGGRR